MIKILALKTAESGRTTKPTSKSDTERLIKKTLEGGAMLRAVQKA